jgi:hypothetical protein
MKQAEKGCWDRRRKKKNWRYRNGRGEICRCEVMFRKKMIEKRRRFSYSVEHLKAGEERFRCETRKGGGAWGRGGREASRKIRRTRKRCEKMTLKGLPMRISFLPAPIQE